METQIRIFAGVNTIAQGVRLFRCATCQPI